MARVEFRLPIASFKIVQFTSNERLALENSEAFYKSWHRHNGEGRLAIYIFFRRVCVSDDQNCDP